MTIAISVRACSTPTRFFKSPKIALLRKTVCAACATAVASGCTTMVAYAPRPDSQNPAQTLRYTQGVGTLSERDSVQEIFMYPTFKTQGTTRPTFTIGYANNAAAAVNFSPDNVKAFFRGAPVPIYTYLDRTTEIESEKRGQQVALAIIGGLAAGAAAYGASRQTYRSNYSGFASSRRGVTTFAGSNTVRVYDPAAGLIAGAAVGGVTALGIQQIEYNAQGQEQAANSILQQNTVDPLQMVTGDLIIRDCCDPFPKFDDVVRFEVTVNGKTSAFEFVRTKLGR